MKQKRRIMSRVIMEKLTIRQVSEATGISTHTLRFWEKEFSGVLNPPEPQKAIGIIPNMILRLSRISRCTRKMEQV